VGFAANFYKALLGTSDLRTLLARAGQLIQQDVPGAAATFFLRQTDGCELHVVADEGPTGPRVEDCFTDDLIEAVCKASRPCALDDLVGMGLVGNITLLRSVSLATLPLNDLGRSLGFVLLSRAAVHPLSADEVERVSLITCGLSRAIRACTLTLHSRD
jgi:GAF domain-containing protein